MSTELIVIIIILLLLFVVVKPSRNLVGGSGESMFSAPNVSASGNSFNFISIIITVVFLVGIIYAAATINSHGSIPI
uniref:Preprotein translocase subunit SecG n=1 Tax=viral metagenome TaxID=1070528 RepID=A0A6C0D955_9ZZZZ